MHEDSSTADPERGTGLWPPLAVADDLTLPYLGDVHFASLVFEQKLAHTAEAQWSTSATSLDSILPHALTTVRASRMKSALADLHAVFDERAIALVTLRQGTVHVRVAAAEQALVSDIEDWLRQTFPATKPTERQEMPVRFWTCSPHGASSVTRLIDVPSFAEIEANYPRAVRDQLAELAATTVGASESGRLLLWYGPPGTGKTYALRARGWEWRSWCTLHYVIDPEVFFGQRADYMVDVLLEDEDYLGIESLKPAKRSNWRLMVLEDTGELLAADAKERTGQGLSRLLNLVDGIVGQGLRVLVLVTTNEPLRRLHPAVARPGRCAARVEFEPFSAAEAAQWLAFRGLAHETIGSATLAQLFARLHGREVQPDRGVGFGVER
jgi:hypothetical protein